MLLTEDMALKRASSGRPRSAWLPALSLALGAGLVFGWGCAGKAPTEVVAGLPEIQLSMEQVTEWESFLQPSSQESRWRSIDWRWSIWDAVVEAVETGKPLLLLSMNGHPKGFT